MSAGIGAVTILPDRLTVLTVWKKTQCDNLFEKCVTDVDVARR